MGVRIGADVGGTFTDVVVERSDGTYASTKVLTTHDAPEQAILDGLERLAAAESNRDWPTSTSSSTARRSRPMP